MIFWYLLESLHIRRWCRGERRVKNPLQHLSDVSSFEDLEVRAGWGARCYIHLIINQLLPTLRFTTNAWKCDFGNVLIGISYMKAAWHEKNWQMHIVRIKYSKSDMRLNTGYYSIIIRIMDSRIFYEQRMSCVFISISLCSWHKKCW